MTCCLLADATSSAIAQEYSPVVDDRVETGDAQPPLVETQTELREGWDLGAVISAAYDDNIFLSATKPESDMVFRAAPTVAYTKGDAKEGEGGFPPHSLLPPDAVVAG